MNLHKIYSIFFLPFIVGLLTMLVVTGCSDDDEELQSQYGYVQFKLYKSTSFEKGTTTRAVGKLKSMSITVKDSPLTDCVSNSDLLIPLCE